MEAFCEELLLTGLPDKCSGDSPAPAGDEEPMLVSEFTKAIEELAKSKLEKPKTLGELMTRWWSEVAWDLLEFDRQAREVEELRKIRPEELIAFAERVLGGGAGGVDAGAAGAARRKAVVAIVGSAELAPAVKAGAPAEEGVHWGDSEAPKTVSDGPIPAPAPQAEASSLSSSNGPLHTVSFSRGGKEAMKLVSEFSAFKRGCEVYPNVAALHRI